MTILDTIKSIAKVKGITISTIEKGSDIGNGVINKWDTTYPRTDILNQVADYLNVSIDLLCGRETPQVATIIPNEIITLWLTLDEFQRAEVKGFMQSFNKKTNKK